MTYEEIGDASCGGATAGGATRRLSRLFIIISARATPIKVNYTNQLCAEHQSWTNVFITDVVVEQNAAYNAYVEHDETLPCPSVPSSFLGVPKGTPIEVDLRAGLEAENMMIVDLRAMTSNAFLRQVASGLSISAASSNTLRSGR